MSRFLRSVHNGPTKRLNTKLQYKLTNNFILQEKLKLHILPDVLAAIVLCTSYIYIN